MSISPLSKVSISKALLKVRNDAETFFKVASSTCKDPNGLIPFPLLVSDDINYFWNQLPKADQNASALILDELIALADAIVRAMKTSLLLNEADARDIGICTKKMRAALKFREFRFWDTEVQHDEGTVLGITPPGQSENGPITPEASRQEFFQCIEQLEKIVELLSITPSHLPDGVPQNSQNLPPAYRPKTAFVMMRISPEFDDIYDAYKECFVKFGITATRADEIEHEEVITERIMEEIKTSEFLVGDLTGERPSVYYEIGYAHALKKPVIMYRKKGTHLHFDLSVHNCPEYESIRELKAHLLKRLEDITKRRLSGG